MTQKKLYFITKKELALRYYPDDTPQRASDKLREQIATSPNLLDDLMKAGYRKEQKTLTPKQIRIIYDHLGEPE